MALLDVSEVFSDPLFTSEVTLVRREESTDEFGNIVPKDIRSMTIQAVVTSDQKTLSRLPEEMRAEGQVVVRFCVADVGGFQGVQFDEVIWRGNRFTITDRSDHAQFGRGMIKLVCSPKEVTDGGY